MIKKLNFNFKVGANLVDETARRWTTTTANLQTTNIGNSATRWLPSPEVTAVEFTVTMTTAGVLDPFEYQWNFRSKLCEKRIEQAQATGELIMPGEAES